MFIDVTFGDAFDCADDHGLCRNLSGNAAFSIDQMRNSIET